MRNAAAGFLLAAAALAAPAWACAPATPAVRTYPYPGAEKIPFHNDLTKPAGKVRAEVGQVLVLQGVVLDARCRPVKDAVVELWQADQYGKYILATGADLVSAPPAFAGAGRTYTQTDGSFQFTTLFPGAVGTRAPNLNIRVQAEGLKRALNTQLFFANDARNAKDPIYRYLRPATRDLVTLHMQPMSGIDGVAASLQIVLPQNLSYLTY